MPVMSILIVLYIPVKDPAAFLVQSEGFGGEYTMGFVNAKMVKIGELYDRYLDNIRQKRNGDNVGVLFDTGQLPPVLKEVKSSTETVVGSDKEKLLTLKEVVSRLFEAEGVNNDYWNLTNNEQHWQVSAVLERSKCDSVMHRLAMFGFGKIAGTAISLFPSSFYESGDQIDPDKIKDFGFKDLEEKSEFVKSVKARITVAEVVGYVKRNTELTFDSLILLSVASVIAGMGLVEDSTVSLVASMLISPMMCPIVGFTFGFVIKNIDLCKLGLKNTLISLGICVFFGLLLGLIAAYINQQGAFWGSSVSWPSKEMKSRGLLRGLWVGVIVALTSGTGVALSILGGNISSLVGVAISASILPPVVNAGLLWGHGIVWSIAAPPYTNSTSNQHLKCPSLANNLYKFQYTCSIQNEMLILGAVSLLLTLVNVICIFFSGILVLKIKEVAPITISDQVFWRINVPLMKVENITTSKLGHIVRNTYVKKNMGQIDLAKFAKEFSGQYKSLKTDSERKKFMQKWQAVINSLDDDSMVYESLPRGFSQIFRPDEHPPTLQNSSRSVIGRFWNFWTSKTTISSSQHSTNGKEKTKRADKTEQTKPVQVENKEEVSERGRFKISAVPTNDVV